MFALTTGSTGPFGLPPLVFWGGAIGVGWIALRSYQGKKLNPFSGFSGTGRQQAHRRRFAAAARACRGTKGKKAKKACFRRHMR